MLKLIIPPLFGFIIAFASGPIWIPFFRKLKFGQYIRVDGPQAHLAKQGTPTFGGAIFITGIMIGTISLSFFESSGISLSNIHVIAVLTSLLGYGLIGLADDYLKVVQKKNDGLSAIQKIIGLVLVTSVLYFSFFSAHMSSVFGWIEFSGLPWFVIFFFIAVATTNSTNLTDGLDGLCGSVTLVVAVFFSVVAYKMDNQAMLSLNLITVGSLFGYLIYNWYPAKVFMGDMGSLAIGGYVLANAITFGIEWFIPIFGLIYLIESVSVILQVGYYKTTGGKRLFKMAPIHHHFEALGYNEVRIVTLFSALTAVMCGLSYLLLC